MRVALCVLLGVLVGCTDEHRSQPRDAEVAEDARVTPRVDGSVDRDAGQSSDCQAAQADDVQLLLFQSSDDRRVQPMAMSLLGPVHLSGIVTARGQGFPTRDAAPGPPPPDAAQYSFVRIADGMRVWTIVTRGLADLRIRERAQVQVELKSNTQVFGPPQQWILVREAEAVAFFYGQESALERLPSVPGFRFRVGRRGCTQKNSCGDVGSFELSASLPSGANLTLAPGQRETRDGFSVTHHETRALLGMTSGCPDYSPMRTRLMVERESLPDPGAFDCATSESSDLADARVEFPSDSSCSFTLAQVRAGVEFPFRIVVDRDIAGVAGLAPDIGGCEVPEAGTVRALATLTGNRQYYGVTDVGGCFGQPLHAGTLRRGSYADALRWDGVNWYGPSDTGERKGEPFPAGIYTLTVTARGYFDVEDGADAGSGTPFALSGTRKILIHE